MAIRSRATLKTFFETDDRPSQQEFYDLIDSLVHKNEDVGQPSGTAPLNADSKVPAANLPVTVAPRTALTGGAAGALDAIVTADGAVATGEIAFVVVSSEFSVWQLQASTAVEDAAAGLVRPDDYEGTTNFRVWVRIS